MNEQDSGFEPIADDSLDAIDAACDRFQAALREGEPATIEQFVDTVPEDARRHLAPELVDIDIHFRRQQGENPTAVGYLLRLPEYAEAINELFASHLRADVVGDKKTSGLSGSLHRGTRLGTYEIIGFLGRGGMGTVYRARHTKLDRVVALKVLPPGLLSNADTIARFEGEVRALGSLDHPNVVRATDADDDDGYHYFAMDYVPGIDLSQLSQQVGPLPVADACELIRQAAEGLEYLFQRGIVHRDIKPANLMLCPGLKEHGDADCTRQTVCCDEAPLVKILDLGLARLRQWRDENDPITSTGQLLGTLDFMAPEQLDDSREVDIRADIYGLGATLYKLLTGKTPYVGGSHLHTLRALATESPPSVRSHLPDLPEPLVAAVDRMLAREPAARFDTPARVAEALAPFAEGADPRALVRQIKRPCSDESSSSESSDAEHVAPTLAADPTSVFGQNRIRAASADCAGAVHPAAGRRRRAFVFIGLIAIVVAVAAANHLMKAPDSKLPKPGPTVAPKAGRGADRPPIHQHDPETARRGRFHDSGQRLGDGCSRAVRLGDFDADGDPDAFVVNRYEEPNRVWINDGHGTFTDSGQRLGNSYSWDVALGDLDDDGDLDAVVVNCKGQPGRIWFNDGGGNFSDSGHEISGVDAHGIALADLDADGDLDVVIADTGANTVWRNDGSGRFMDSGQQLGRADSWCVALADFDGDGHTDAFVGNRGLRVGEADRVWLNDGDGNFSDSGQRLGDAVTLGVSLADLNGDGAVDVFTANRGHQLNRIWLNDGEGNLGGIARLPLMHSLDVALGDLDGDGDHDALVANAKKQPNQILWNNGHAEFALGATQWLGDSNTSGAALGDLDGDGDLDTFVTNFESQPNRVWLNEGGGIFRDSGQLLGESRSTRIALGDLDGDGDLDVFVPNVGNQPNRVWLNDGQGTFQDSGQMLGNSGSKAAMLRDFDGDGDLDAFVINYYHGQPNRVWLNDGHGRFTDSGQELGTSESEGLAMGDFDGDGDDDAFVANLSDQPNRVYWNDGKGTFTDSGQQLGDSHSKAVCVADLDGDGDLDAVVSNDGPNRVWLNDGKARFELGQLLDGSHTSVGVALADLDGDEDLDAFIGNNDSQPNHVWLNWSSSEPAVQPSIEASNGTSQPAAEPIEADADNDGGADVGAPDETTI